MTSPLPNSSPSVFPAPGASASEKVSTGRNAHMDAHPLADKYPLMGDGEFAALKADIAAHGLKHPVMMFEDKVLDGRHRLRACNELGFTPVFQDFDGTPEEAAAFVDSVNLHRRHLTAEWRRERVKKLREAGMSTRAIADAVGADARTVRRDLESGGASAPPALTEEPDPCPTTSTSTPPSAPSQTPSTPVSSDAPKVKGKDGKKYAATRKRGRPKGKAATATTTAAGVPPAGWADAITHIDRAIAAVQAAPPVPKGGNPWIIINRLESLCKALVGAAMELRRKAGG